MKYTAYYCSGMTGYELRVDEAGENIYYRYNGGKEHRAKIKYTVKGDPYFIAWGRRIHLSECLRIGI